MVITAIEQIMDKDPAGARLPHDEKYEQGIAFIDGKYCVMREAVVPIFDLGFTECDATYEKGTVLRGCYFRLQDHFDRFARSCAKFRLRNPYSDSEMLEIFNTMLSLSGFRNAGVLWFVTRGIVERVSDLNRPDAFKNRLYVVVDNYTSIVSTEQRSRGLRLIVSEKYIRIPPKAVDPTAKNFHWQDMKLSLFEATDRGAEWSVLTDIDGYLTEAPGANIFLVKNGELYTPNSGCLEGITRLATLELSEMLKVRSHLEKVHADQLRRADEAFITSSAGGIMPVRSVDGIALGGIDGPGELTTRLHNLYWEKIWAGWKSIPVEYKTPRSVATVEL